jgi:hypothetical protein
MKIRLEERQYFFVVMAGTSPAMTACYSTPEGIADDRAFQTRH